MEDALGRKVHEGDLILELDPSCGWAMFGVAFGGETESGRIRYLVPNIENGKKPEKRNGKKESIIKVDRFLISVSKKFSRRNLISDSLKTELFELQEKIKGNDCIIDKISIAAGIPPTTVYYEE